MTKEKMLESEIEEFQEKSGNSRNGYYLKKVRSDSGEIELNIPRDRNSDFEPQIVEKGQNRALHLVINSWKNNWDELSTYFQYSEPIRRIIYTTNTIEGFNRQIRKITKTKGGFNSLEPEL
jgi:transposase-like protein